MTVYVDDMRAPYGRLIMCHMIAETEAELHAMADKIGVARKWYQGDHYDIALSKRALAVNYGAVSITWREAGAMMALTRLRKLPFGHPSTAPMRLCQARSGKFALCKNRQPKVMQDGSCIECGADQGVACRGDIEVEVRQVRTLTSSRPASESPSSSQSELCPLSQLSTGTKS